MSASNNPNPDQESPPELSKDERLTLEWLRQADSSALGECKGPALDRLAELELVTISAPDARGDDYRRVVLTPKGWAAGELPRLDLVAADTKTAADLACRVVELTARLIDRKVWDAWDRRAERKSWTPEERAAELAEELAAGRRLTASVLASEAVLTAIRQVDWAKLALYRHGECDVLTDAADGAAVFDLDGQPFAMIAGCCCVGGKAGALERAAEICAALNLWRVLEWISRHGRIAQIDVKFAQSAGQTAATILGSTRDGQA